MKQSINLFWISGSFVFSIFSQSVQAQIIPDGTTPTTSELCTAVCEIIGGTQTGENLFHSFSQFNINSDQQVTFSDPGVTNIITRVTGGNPSNILGTLDVAGDANLFLINPNGIIFGSTAFVNVSGSFVATTADAIQFSNQGSFNVNPANSPDLLTVNPSALLFNQITAQSPPSIELNDGLIFLPDAQSLVLLGGNINIAGDFNIEHLIAPSGRIELGGVLGAGIVGLNNVNGKNLSLSFPANIARGDVSISNGVIASVAGDGSGSIAINARNINIAQSNIIAGVSPDFEATNNQLGTINLDATEGIEITRATLTNEVQLEAVGNAGDIQIKAGSLLLNEFSNINSTVNPRASGNAGNVLIQANDVAIANDASINTLMLGSGEGDGGDIQIDADSLLLENGSLNARAIAPGSVAGNVSINANNVSLLGDRSLIGTAALVSASRGGAVNIQANAVSLSNGATLFSSTTEEAGRAGNINITANTVSLADSAIYNDTIGLGDAGDTQINARTLNISNGGSISTSTNGAGNAGSIFINASEFVTLSGTNPNAITIIRNIPSTTSSGLFAFTDTNATGRGGNIQVNTGNLSILDGAVISARTRGIAPGGNITVNATNVAATNGGQILTSAFNQGMAGNITVNATNSVSISGSDRTYNDRLQQTPDRIDNDGAASGFLARVRGDAIADAGQINVTAPSISLDNQGTISTATTQGAGGQISLRGRNVALNDNSSITATAGTANAGGNGGNIDISSELFFATRNSAVTANAFTGNGGNIRIATQGFFLSPDSVITASSAQGIDGVVEIIVVDDEPSRGLVSLPEQPVDVSNLVARGCTADTNIATNTSEFIITGRGGLPPTPGEAINANSVLADLGTPVQTQAATPLNTVSNLNNSQPKSLVEAQGWMVGSNGEVVLMAQVPTATTYTSWSTPVACNAP
ncbi:filamentous hemagglutinin family outer membrane protein [Gloeocapsa sp. PCC 7428]|uniref:two-partner secretion domain-containing protein n=1 Tax=Gloeocapsa sp. PCC 7428 TaxID=1173026 RepID=UPI0002A5E5B1|nr:S-layer family protein [Gloeocapsa sp. PCC 7428]AFZ29758.1 filamentous hemagglutinin family outer membrane protein [Gloeocapsa sp. PCC 7428]